ncbi:hypothetical protein DRF68_13385 [Candidatus Chryseobacterium massiliae]|uniref:Uncharacterized protein n=1 Tax=Candidatus Chryseobacterium massiliense TaxID=204089 RepID=A0A3D9B1D1_9FLAO|nr:hypothetical protein DRF68_13385 [Candidatus Chryseobacterium massiliae]
MSSGFHYTKFLTKILNIIFMNVKPALRSECDQAFIRFLKSFFEVFNDKIKRNSFESRENHYFLAEINF